MIWKIYDALIADPFILEKVENRIKFYEYPETGDVTNPYIVIDPIAPPRPVGYGDNQRIIYEYFYQIDVWTRSFSDTENIMKKTSDVLWNMGFGESGSGLDEYDNGIYRRAKRFIGQFENFKEE